MDSSEQAEAASRHGSDYDAFTALESEDRQLEPGFWSVFVICAWVGSRCPQFTAAVQAYEREKRIDSPGFGPACAWTLLSDIMKERFDVTMSQAARDIRSAIGDRRLPPGFGRDQITGQDRAIALAEWLSMRATPNLSGSIVPGVSDVALSSADVRAAFDASRPPVAAVSTDAEPALETPHKPPRIGEGTLRAWFEERVKKFEGQSPPTWKQCWDAAKLAHPSNQVTKELLLATRRSVAPDWKSGRRGG